MARSTSNLETIAQRLRQEFSEKDAAREKALRLSREVIRYSSETIRALHRQEIDKARSIMEQGRVSLSELDQAVAQYGELLRSGFHHDAQKEFAEASITLSLITRQPLPEPEALGVSPAAYLNGLGEAVGEARRYLLDSLRRNDLSPCEELLAAMDDIYAVLVTMDFPDAMTGGLRRTTDMVRGVLEKTRGDLTLTFRQRELEARLDKVFRTTSDG